MRVQPRGDEAPELVQPDRRRDDDSGDGRYLQLQDERVGDSGQCQCDVAAFLLRLGDRSLEGTLEEGEDIRVEDPAHDHAEHDRYARLDQPRTKFAKVIGQRHRRLPILALFSNSHRGG